MSRFSSRELREFHEQLERLSADLLERLRTSRSSSQPVDLAQPIGRLSRVDALQAQQVARAQRASDESRLQLIKAALARIRAGTYGTCIRCEEDIELRRLSVAPESSQCMACRQERDQR